MRCGNNLSNYGYNGTNFPNIHIVFDSMGSGYTDGAKGQQYATSLHSADFLINVFRPGGHADYVEGLTLGFKNHYGTYDVDHGGSTAPGYLRDINCTGAVFNKNVLSICSGIFGAQEASGDPGSSAISYYKYAQTMDSTITNKNASSTTIIMSTDPVSAEMQTIKMMRLNQTPTGGYAVANMPKYLRASGGVAGAIADATLNVGIIDESQMTIRRIINGLPTTSLREPSVIETTGSGARVVASQIRGQKSTFIEFMLPSGYSGKESSIEILNYKGERIARLATTVMGAHNHVSWNEIDTRGKPVPASTYLVCLTSGDIHCSSQFTIMR
jgi:hypothetical protein